MTTQKTKNLIKMIDLIQESVQEMDAGGFNGCSVNRSEYSFPIHCAPINCFKCSLLVEHKNTVKKVSEIINK